VPIALSAFSADRILNAGAPEHHVVAAVHAELTLQVARGSNSTADRLHPRHRPAGPARAASSRRRLYVDDVYVARPQGAVLDIYDIERLEVLRGPQARCMAATTIGGAIKYVTKSLATRLTSTPSSRSALTPSTTSSPRACCRWATTLSIGGTPPSIARRLR